MRPRPEREPRIEREIDRGGIDRLAPRRDDPEPVRDPERRELRLRRAHPVGVGHLERLVRRQRAPLRGHSGERRGEAPPVAKSAVNRLTGQRGATVMPGSSKTGDSSAVPACASATSTDSAPDSRSSSAHASALSASASKASAA